MNTDPCPEHDAVIAAVEAGRYDDWVQSHLAECAACEVMLSDRLFASLDRSLAARDEGEEHDAEALAAELRDRFADASLDDNEPTRLSENEAALLLTDWASPPRQASEISEADRIRLADARNALAQEEVWFAPSSVRAVGEASSKRSIGATGAAHAVRGRTPLRGPGAASLDRKDLDSRSPTPPRGALPEGGRHRGRWSAGIATAFVAAAATALVMVVPADFDEMGDAAAGVLPAGEPPTGKMPTGEPPTGEPPTGEPLAAELPTGEPPTAGLPAAGRPAAELPLPARGDDVLIGVELSLGEEMCIPHHPEDKDVTPCRWRVADEQLHFYYRREPTARSKYVVVLGRDALGRVQVLYPSSADSQVLLDVTRYRNPDECPRGLCWLEGGVYHAEKGRLSVAAIFDDKPLPVGALVKTWNPEVWAGPTRKVELFELEVVP